MTEKINMPRTKFTNITEAIGYFLAGLFAICTTLIHVSGENITIEVPYSGVMVAVSSWLTLVVGVILIFAGFFLLLSLVSTYIEKIWNKVEKYLIPALFLITTIEVSFLRLIDHPFSG